MFDTLVANVIFYVIAALLLWLCVAIIVAIFQDQRTAKRRRFERKVKPYGHNPKDTQTLRFSKEASEFTNDPTADYFACCPAAKSTNGKAHTWACLHS